MAEPSQGQVSSPDIPAGSTQLCRLLALPKELRLLIYEAYFGPLRICNVAWAEEVCWWIDADGAAGTVIGTNLLITSRQIHQEALAVMLDRTELQVDFELLIFSVPWTTTHQLAKADAVRVLRTIRAVVIEIQIDGTDRILAPTMYSLRGVFTAMNHGAIPKKLSFDFLSATTLQTKEPVVPDDEEFKTAISSLRCADGVMRVRRFAAMDA
ncbi:hypothetical protein LTR27_000491 [Elasticomyces elasticus]|nr:hypothetical protein LTR27_000491 [Elasticomyces elasticus]